MSHLAVVADLRRLGILQIFIVSEKTLRLEYRTFYVSNGITYLNKNIWILFVDNSKIYG